MVAKVCDSESRRDTWFENHLVFLGTNDDLHINNWYALVSKTQWKDYYSYIHSSLNKFEFSVMELNIHSHISLYLHLFLVDQDWYLTKLCNVTYGAGQVYPTLKLEMKYVDFI